MLLFDEAEETIALFIHPLLHTSPHPPSEIYPDTAEIVFSVTIPGEEWIAGVVSDVIIVAIEHKQWT